VSIDCPYCGKPAEFVSGPEIYPHRGDLASKQYWLCRKCDAYVGCHQNTTTPLGRLADPKLRKAKIAAHAAFDPIWRSAHESRRPKARRDAYKWLAEALGMRPADTHIGMFDEKMCMRVVTLCKEYAVKKLAAEMMEK